MPGEDEAWYDYAVIRVVPVVDRGEFVNAGVILRARTRNYLGVHIELDETRLLALAPGTDVDAVREHLRVFEAIARGDAEAGGPIARLSVSERFHWLTTPRSTVIQTSPAHAGRCHDPETALEELMNALVRTRTDR